MVYQLNWLSEFATPLKLLVDKGKIMKKLLTTLALIGVASTAAAVEFDISHPNIAPGGVDTFRTQNGAECSTSINTPGGYRETGFAGSYAEGYDYIDQDGYEVTAYVRWVKPLGEPAPRINCNKLYELELLRIQAEIKALEAAAAAADAQSNNVFENNAAEAVDDKTIPFDIDIPDPGN